MKSSPARWSPSEAAWSTNGFATHWESKRPTAEPEEEEIPPNEPAEPEEDQDIYGVESDDDSKREKN